MTRFSEHFKMSADDVLEYIFENTDFFDCFENMECTEIGDGNINYIYRVKDKNSNKSVIVKHGDIQTRVRPDGYLGLARNLKEMNVLKLQYKHAPDFVPEVFHYNPVMALIVMEDIGEYKKMRDCFLNFDILPNVSEKIVEFLIKAELSLTNLVSNDKKELAAKFINKDMCKISEELVFTHPYKDVRNRNILTSENREWLEKRFYKNEELCTVAAFLKHKFENCSETLIHGDLHTGSMFALQDNRNDTKLKVIDPEFAFFGPIGYDLGNVIAHFCFAKKYAQLVKQKDCEKEKKRLIFYDWLNVEIKKLITLFNKEAFHYFKKHIEDPIYSTERFIENYVESIIDDAYKFAGAEINRRVIGSAKVEELTLITDVQMRVKMERELVTLGTGLMLGKIKKEQL